MLILFLTENYSSFLTRMYVLNFHPDRGQFLLRRKHNSYFVGSLPPDVWPIFTSSAAHPQMSKQFPLRWQRTPQCLSKMRLSNCHESSWRILLKATQYWYVELIHTCYIEMIVTRILRTQCFAIKIHSSIYIYYQWL